MKRSIGFAFSLLAAVLTLPVAIRAQAPPPTVPASGQRDKAVYQKHLEDPVLKEMEDRDKKVKEDAQHQWGHILLSSSTNGITSCFLAAGLVRLAPSEKGMIW